MIKERAQLRLVLKRWLQQANQIPRTLMPTLDHEIFLPALRVLKPACVGNLYFFSILFFIYYFLFLTQVVQVRQRSKLNKLNGRQIALSLELWIAGWLSRRHFPASKTGTSWTKRNDLTCQGKTFLLLSKEN